jgi:hypothetical protein
MGLTADVFFTQDGREPNSSGKAYFDVPVAKSMAVLGLFKAGVSSGDAASLGAA